jgi:hypothetical protein
MNNTKFNNSKNYIYFKEIKVIYLKFPSTFVSM